MFENRLAIGLGNQCLNEVELNGISTQFVARLHAAVPIRALPVRNDALTPDT